MSNEKPGPGIVGVLYSAPVDPPDNVAQGFEPTVVAGDEDYDEADHMAGCSGCRRAQNALSEVGVELLISTDPREWGATHRLHYQDGTIELLRIDGLARLEKLP